MLIFMALGYTLVKVKAAKALHAKTLSALLLYGATPGMIITSFQEMEYSAENNVKLLWFFILSLVAQLMLFGLMFLLFRDKIMEGVSRGGTKG